MHSEELMEWLMEKNLFSMAKNKSQIIKKILTEALNAKKEGILIISDYGKANFRCAPILSGAYYLAAQSLGLNAAIVMQGIKNKSEEADDTVKSLVKKLKRENIVALSLSNRIGKFGEMGNFKDIMKNKMHRYISTTGLIGLGMEQAEMLFNSININYKNLDKQANKIKEELDWARDIKITTQKGTNLKINIKGNKALTNSGYIKNKGNGGNMPSGEVYIAPSKQGVEGIAVIDGSSRHKNGTCIANKPITIKINKGMITNIEGSAEARILRDSIDWTKNKAKLPSEVSMIGEIGIGLNPKASIIGTMIIDEKTYGTAHIGIGGNSWFGGEIFSSVHLDQVFRDPIIMIDGKELKLPKRKELE